MPLSEEEVAAQEAADLAAHIAVQDALAKPASSVVICPACPVKGWPADPMEPYAGVLRCVRCGHCQS
jgi:hypothetical protein